jgi:hypothetical protein
MEAWPWLIWPGLAYQKIRLAEIDLAIMHLFLMSQHLPGLDDAYLGCGQFLPKIALPKFGWAFCSLQVGQHWLKNKLSLVVEHRHTKDLATIQTSANLLVMTQTLLKRASLVRAPSLSGFMLWEGLWGAPEKLAEYWGHVFLVAPPIDLV